MKLNLNETDWRSVASYVASFLSNLSVVGVGLAIFREDHLYLSLGIALFSLVIGSLITITISKRG